MANKNGIILLFKESMNISEREWNKLCLRYANRNISTLTDIICDVCHETPKAVKAELAVEFERLKEEKK